jgi:hypothetical protein
MFTVDVDLKEMDALLASLGRTNQQIFSVMSNTLAKYMRKAERDVKKQLTGRKLSVRSGRLRNSISNRVEVTSSKEGDVILKGVLGVLTPEDGRVLNYAGTHEYGRTIWNVNSSLLTIPLKAAKAQDRDKGANRFTTAEARQKYAYTFWRLTRRNNLILFGVEKGPRKKGKFGNLVPLFLGRRAVQIKEKAYLRDAITAITEPLQDDIAAQVAKLLSKIEAKQAGPKSLFQRIFGR